MSFKRRYRQSGPVWLKAKYASKCTCGTAIELGASIFYYPSTKTAVCHECGLKGADDIREEQAAEDRYNAITGGW